MIHQTISLNNSLNREAQNNVDAQEPKVNIWDDDLKASLKRMSIAETSDKKRPIEKPSAARNPLAEVGDKKRSIGQAPEEAASDERQNSVATDEPSNSTAEKPAKTSRFSSFRKSIGIKSTEERAVAKIEKHVNRSTSLKEAILEEENGRWPDDRLRQIVAVYQEKVGMTRKIADLRARQPLQYLHLLRAGYFEPIPTAWAGSASNPLKFSIEASEGWRGITPAWRGYEDTAEERLYWVLNHREGSNGPVLKPDFISTMDMARARMASAVEPPPEYFSPNDTCHVQHTSAGYSKQVMPASFTAFDRPILPTDDTMILLDVSGSMDFDPLRPNYDQYLITGYSHSTQPKNKGKSPQLVSDTPHDTNPV